MADSKITGLTENTTPLGTDLVEMVDDPGGSPLSQKITIANLMTLSGAWPLLESHNASASATLDFTTWLNTAKYNNYIIVISGIVPATTSTRLLFRVSTDGGSTYLATGVYSSATFVMRAGGTGSGTGAESGLTSIDVTGFDVSNNASYGIDGMIKLYSPGSGVRYTKLEGELVYLTTSGGTFLIKGLALGSYLAVTAVNAFRFLMSSGNITSGNISIYGVPKV